METMTLGRTGIPVTRTGFGALPIQRVTAEAAVALLHRAHAGGITFYDTARGYSDSEAKLGLAFADRRAEVVIATKTPKTDRDSVLKDIRTSLEKLQTGYIDLIQLHNPKTLPDPDAADSSYAGLREARERGLVRAVGITSHKLEIALAAVRSGRYDTIQFPLSAISSDRDLSLIDAAAAANVGVIAMKAFCGGLLTNARLVFTFLRQFPTVVPIWGIQRQSELDEFLALDAAPPVMTATMTAELEQTRRDLAGEFCRGCGYCLPCPADIPIPAAARITHLMRRAPSARFLAPDWQEQMARIDNCIDCRKCVERCPYSLDTPRLLKDMLRGYRELVAELT